MNYLEIKNFPKVDLHCHLDGSIRPEVIKDIITHDNLNITTDIEILQNNLSVQIDCNSLVEYLQKFDIPIACIQSEYGLETATYSVIEDAFNETIIYLEIRFAPLFSVNENLDCDAVVQSVLKGVSRAEADFDIKVSIILCAMRHQPPEDSFVLVDIAHKYKDTGVGGIDIAGDEANFPLHLFEKLLDYANEKNIRYTLHAGETGDFSNIDFAIQKGATRVGHGLAVLKNTESIRLAYNHNLLFELCPTSNFQTKACNPDEDYPIKQFLDNSLNVCINTDNRTVSNTSLTDEYVLLQKYIEVTPEFMRQMALSAIDMAFASDEVKNFLYKKIT
ncbi:MAG: adenosine deaminase [Epulopiscium sp. Nele67-Bin004]|nr:MAG: adenosine deaminase [Epulopiscium sp. Nele67-Bin004]